MEQREWLSYQHPEIATMSFEEVLKIVEELSKEQKMALAQKLGSPWRAKKSGGNRLK